MEIGAKTNSKGKVNLAGKAWDPRDELENTPYPSGISSRVPLFKLRRGLHLSISRKLFCVFSLGGAISKNLPPTLLFGLYDSTAVSQSVPCGPPASEAPGGGSGGGG